MVIPKIYLMKSGILFVPCINQNKLLKKDTITKVNTIIKADSIFMNSEKSKTSELHVLILQLTDKLELKRREKSVALSNFSI